MFFTAVIGLVAALVMGGLWLWRGLPSAAAATVLWFVFALYELLQYVRLVCSGDCSVSVDLVFWALLLLLSVVAAQQALRSPAGSDEGEE